MLLLLCATLAVGQGGAEPPLLAPGKVVRGEITAAAAHPDSPKFAQHKDGRVALGVEYRVQVPETGSYHLDLRSYDFDAYLILTQDDGSFIAENDDGLILNHARLAGKWTAGRTYRVWLCSLFGKVGHYQVRMEAGKPPTLDPTQRMAAGIDDLRHGLGLQTEAHGPRSEAVAGLWNRLGNALLDAARAPEAVDAFGNALEIWAAQPVPDPSDRVIGLNNLGRALDEAGRLEEAFEVQTRGLAQARATLGMEHRLTSIAFSNLASIENQRGHLLRAIDLSRQSLAVSVAVHGEGHVETSSSLNNLGIYLSHSGRYEEARPLFEQALANFAGSSQQDSLEHLQLQINIGEFLLTRGLPEQARPLIENSQPKILARLGEFHPMSAYAIRALGLLYGNLGEYQRSIPYFQRAAELYSMMEGPTASSTSYALTQLATALEQTGQLDEAEEVHREVLKRLKQRRPPSTLGIALAEANLGRFRVIAEDYDAAIAMLQGALTVLEAEQGDLHTDTLETRRYLATALARAGRHQAAAVAFGQHLADSLAYLDQELPTMAEAQRMRLMAVHPGPGDYLNEVHASGAVDPEVAWQLCLQWKGKATRLQRAARRIEESSRDPELLRLRQEIQAVAGQIGQQLQEEVPDPEAVAALRDQREGLEAQWSRRLALADVVASPDLAQIQAAVPPDAALVDLYVGKRVWAFTWTRSGGIALLDLGAVDTMRAAQRRFLTGVLGRPGPNASRGGRDAEADLTEDADTGYASLLWQPIANTLGAVDEVFLSPASFLCELPFGVLPDGAGAFLIERIHFHYPSDLSTLVFNGASSRSVAAGPVLLVGGVDYGSAGGRWPTLPATRSEVERLHALFQDDLHWSAPVELLVGAEAEAGRLREALIGKQYLHLATHGYFEPADLPAPPGEAMVAGNLGDGTVRGAIQAFLPGLRSGLVFAGANAQADLLGGGAYLSAEEIQQLDLSACRLAVLSACETALGTVRSGEGLISLRRAFEVAGADAVLSTLWQVEDRATAELMESFYRMLLVDLLPLDQALRRAQLELLARQRAAGDPRPASWGPFVLSGRR